MREGQPSKHRRRKLGDYEYEAFRSRLHYLLEFLFQGKHRAMARALNICTRELRHTLSGSHRPTVRLVSHVVASLRVNADWLLSGYGAVFRDACVSDGLRLSASAASSFSQFNVTDFGAVSTAAPAAICCDINVDTSDCRPYIAAGRAAYQARVHNKLRGFFLGRNVFVDSAAQAVLPLFREQFANLLVSTLGAAAHDLAVAGGAQYFDLNEQARIAATRGCGYGEALCGAATVLNRAESTLATVYDMGLPVVLAAELGEIAAHTAPTVGGIEAGAAIGAAAYTDILILTEQLRSFFSSPGGVFFLAGEVDRGLRLILERKTSLSAVIPAQTDFTFVVFVPYSQEIETFVHTYGGHVIFLNYPTAAVFAQLLQTCNDVYAGKIPHTHD